MSKEVWEKAKKIIGTHHRLELGPYYASQALHAPRHLLFSLARNKFAAKMLPQNKKCDVLELGCGEGLGSVMFSELQHRVTAVDFDEEAIRHAQKTLNTTGIEFICDDFIQGGEIYGSFDAVLSMDVIEHIYQSKENRFFEVICNNLKDNGFCVIGTPNEAANKFTSKENEIAHVNLFSHQRLSELAEKYFHNVFLFSMNDEVVHTGFYPMAHYLIVLLVGKKNK